MLRKLWNSTKDLYERWNFTNTPVLQRQRIFMEEVLEFIQASTMLESLKMFKLEGGNIDAKLRQEFVNEGADVLVTVMGVMMAHGIELHELEQAMIETAQKNDRKTQRTHWIVNGKITKQPRVTYAEYTQTRAGVESLNSTEPTSQDEWESMDALSQHEALALLDRLAGR